MWRWATRGLVLTLMALLLTPALVAQTEFLGGLDRPDGSVTQSGIVLIQGWFLDPGAISKIQLYIDDQFVHDQVLFNQPRIDISEAYPNYPGIHTARPGFVTGFLSSNYTNGPHTIEIIVVMSDGRHIPMGRRTINIDNTVNQSPFGFVDIPDLRGTYNASGSFPVTGWAADGDGVNRVDVLIDGSVMQAAMYGDARPDVAAVYPDFPPAAFSGFVAHVDTTRIADGVHTLTVRVIDKFGLSREIGRRVVQVLNSDNNLKPFGYIDEPKRDATLYGTQCNDEGGGGFSPPVRPQEHITPVRGWALDLGTRTGTGGVAYVELVIDGKEWLSTDDCGFLFGGYANCYGLPRFDVQRFYPNYPNAPRAGFMFTMDVGALMSLGVRPGHHILKVRVGDREQTFADIPNPDGIPVFFTCAEDTFNFASFGFIDQPTTFDFVGGDVTFSGWVIDENGVNQVEILIDGNFVGVAQYGFIRTDVEAEYPSGRASRTSGWRFTMDTRRLSNARHRLTVRTRDNGANNDIIGSVDFYVANP
jgi:hypothetical protein